MVTDLNQKNKQLVWDFWQQLEAASPDQLVQIANESLVSNISWHGPDPINDLHGVQSFVSEFWMPLQKSFRDLKRRTHIFFGGQSNGRIDGKNDGNPIEINGLDWWKRDGEVYIENWVFVDMIHLFRQLGVDLFERIAQEAGSIQSEMR